MEMQSATVGSQVRQKVRAKHEQIGAIGNANSFDKSQISAGSEAEHLSMIIRNESNQSRSLIQNMLVKQQIRSERKRDRRRLSKAEKQSILIKSE
jgi:hypothetical protein